MKWFREFKAKRLDAAARNQIFIPDRKVLDRFEDIVQRSEWAAGGYDGAGAECPVCGADRINGIHGSICSYSDEWEGP